MPTTDWFAEMRRRTNGQLSPRVYQRLYESARECPEGILVDVGTAQGATAISLALGLKQAGKITTLYCVDRCFGSRALQHMGRDHWKNNHDVLRGNLEHYGVLDVTRVLVGTLSEVAHQIPTEMPLSLLCIDTDGCLDRDFDLMYEGMCGQAHLILDDCSPAINSYGRKCIRFSEEELRKYESDHVRSGKWKQGKTILDYTPLGKDYSIHRFVGLLLSTGHLRSCGVIDKTFFGIKPPDAPALDRVGLRRTRDEINRRFVQLRQTAAATAAQQE